MPVRTITMATRPRLTSASVLVFLCTIALEFVRELGLPSVIPPPVARCCNVGFAADGKILLGMKMFNIDFVDF